MSSKEAVAGRRQRARRWRLRLDSLGRHVTTFALLLGVLLAFAGCGGRGRSAADIEEERYQRSLARNQKTTPKAVEAPAANPKPEEQPAPKAVTPPPKPAEKPPAPPPRPAPPSPAEQAKALAAKLPAEFSDWKGPDYLVARHVSDPRLVAAVAKRVASGESMDDVWIKLLAPLTPAQATTVPAAQRQPPQVLIEALVSALSASGSAKAQNADPTGGGHAGDRERPGCDRGRSQGLDRPTRRRK